MKKILVLTFICSAFLMACAHQESSRSLSSVGRFCPVPVPQGLSCSDVYTASGQWNELDSKDFSFNKYSTVSFYVVNGAIHIKNGKIDCEDVAQITKTKEGDLIIQSKKCNKIFTVMPKAVATMLYGEEIGKIDEEFLMISASDSPSIFIKTRAIK